MKEANVGFALGIAGTEVAKEACDIVILDDNIQSMTKAVLWGRNVYDSIRKFLQFQLVVNVVAVSLNFISACAGQELPLGAVPLLWVNMIMDSMGALALATEPPRPQLLQRKPFGTRAPLINREMYRNIAGVSVYQLIVTLVLQFAGLKIFNFPSLGDGFSPEEIFTENRHKLNSIIFNVFVFMQVGSEINSRRIAERNVFEGITKSLWFVIIICVTVVIQIGLMFGVGSTDVGKSIGISTIDGPAWAASIILGFLVLPWGFVVRLIPLDWCLGPIDEDPSQKSKLGRYVAVITDPLSKFFAPVAQVVGKIKRKIPFMGSNDDEDGEGELGTGIGTENVSLGVTGLNTDAITAKNMRVDDIGEDGEMKKTDTGTTNLSVPTFSSGAERLPRSTEPLVRFRVFVHAVAFVNVVSRIPSNDDWSPQEDIHPEAYEAKHDGGDDKM